jgi:hypothetical protein
VSSFQSRIQMVKQYEYTWKKENGIIVSGNSHVTEKCSWTEKDVLHNFCNWPWYLFHLFIYLFDCLIACLFIFSCIYSVTHSFIHVFICLFICLFIYYAISVDSPVAEVFKNVIICKWTKCWLGEKKLNPLAPSFLTLLSKWLWFNSFKIRPNLHAFVSLS